MNRFTSERKIRKRLETGPVPAPPADLLEKIQRDIPRYLAAGGETDDPSERGHGRRPNRLLLAASIATAVTGGALAYLVMERPSTPDGIVAEGEVAVESKERAIADAAEEAGPAAAAPDRAALPAVGLEEERRQVAFEDAQRVASEADRASPRPAAPPVAGEREARETQKAADLRAAGESGGRPAAQAAAPAPTAPVTPPEAAPLAAAGGAAPGTTAPEPPAPARHGGEEAGRSVPPPADRATGSNEAADESAGGASTLEVPAEGETLQRLSAEERASPRKRSERTAPARAFRASAAQPDAEAMQDALGDSYARARSALREGRLPPPETIRVEDFVDFYAAGAAGEDASPLAPLAVELAEILRRSDASRAEDLQGLLERVEKIAESGGEKAGELAALARRALELVEARGARDRE